MEKFIKKRPILANVLSVIVLIVVFVIFKSCVMDEEPSKDVQANSNICADKNKAILAFREGCGPSTSLGFGSGDWDLKDKWCDCIADHYDITQYLDKACSVPKLNVYMSFWNNDEAKVACGTPKEPR